MTHAHTAVFLTLVLAGPAVQAAPAAGEVAIVAERYVTRAEPEANIDSVAVAPARDGRPALLFATAKATDVLKVFHAATSAELAEIGGSGDAPSEFRRPNGISVTDDLLVVVERDNRRISIRALPDYRVLAAFGADVLRKPYGVWVHALGDDRYRLYVTDAYEMPDESVPPNEELNERVRTFLVDVERDGDSRAASLRHRYEKSFGDTTPAGALRVVESLYGDPAHDRLLIAEEDEDPATGLLIKVYDLAGRYTGTSVGRGVFKAQAEGIALYACPDGSGYWISTDQDKERTTWHLFDRQSLSHAGAFAGRRTANTDGIWLAPAGVPGFEQGAFFAVDDDQAVSAFDWAEVLAALTLPAC